MKKTARSKTVADLWPVIHQQLTAMQLAVEHYPEAWHESLQRAVDGGAYFRVEATYGGYGLLGTRMVLVDRKTGETVEVSNVEAERV